jgi:hypothetical protein
MPLSAADIVNRALELIGNQDQVTGVNPTFDGSTAGNAAGVLYTPAVQLLLRQVNPDFARTRVTLAPVAITIPTSWAYAYTYPATCLRMRQVAPAPGSYDRNAATPVRAEIDVDPGAGKVILTNQEAAIAVITTSAVTEAQFDTIFSETVARQLANPFAMALAGRPDFARELLAEAEQFASISAENDDL